MTTSIGAVLRSTGLAKIDRALLARAEKPRVKVWAGSIAVGHEKRAKAYTPIRNARQMRSEEHTSELKSIMRISYAVFCWKKKNYNHHTGYHSSRHSLRKRSH